jgi:hypothetical protein
VTGGCRKVNNMELCNLYSSPNVMKNEMGEAGWKT